MSLSKLFEGYQTTSKQTSIHECACHVEGPYSDITCSSCFVFTGTQSTYICIHRCVSTCVYVHTLAYAHTHMLTHIYICVHIHNVIHTHTHISTSSKGLSVAKGPGYMNQLLQPRCCIPCASDSGTTLAPSHGWGARWQLSEHAGSFEDQIAQTLYRGLSNYQC